MPKLHALYDQRVSDLCRSLNLFCYHTYNSQKSKKGFPDWVIVGRRAVYYVEIKTGQDRLNEDQAKWIRVLQRREPHTYAWVVRETTIDYLDTILTNEIGGQFRQDKRIKAIDALYQLTAAELQKIKKTKPNPSNRQKRQKFRG